MVALRARDTVPESDALEESRVLLRSLDGVGTEAVLVRVLEAERLVVRVSVGVVSSVVSFVSVPTDDDRVRVIVWLEDALLDSEVVAVTTTWLASEVSDGDLLLLSKMRVFDE